MIYAISIGAGFLLGFIAGLVAFVLVCWYAADELDRAEGIDPWATPQERKIHDKNRADLQDQGRA